MPKLRFVLLTALALLVPIPGTAQTSPPTGALVLAHGGSEEWNRQVLQLAAEVRGDVPVEVAILDGPGAAEHRFQDAAERLEHAGVREIVVIPLLVSSHSFFFESIRYLTAETDSIHPMMAAHYRSLGVERADVEVPMRLAPALDDAPELARLLADRARALATDPSRQAVFLVAHGPDEREAIARARWMKNLRRVAKGVQEIGGFQDVRVGLIPATRATPVVREEAVQRARDLIELQHTASGSPVIVVPVLMASGEHSEKTIPADLAGLPILYSGDVLIPHPELTRWFESQVAEAF